MSDNKRSPNYPSISLPEAIELSRTLWEREKKSQVPTEVVAKAWGYKGENGLSRMKIASLKKYGLLEGRGSDGVRLTDLAIHIIAYPEDADERRQAVQEAALKPDLFRTVYQTHAKASDENLRAFLITKQGFSQAGAIQFAKAFRETISLVNPDMPRYNESEDLPMDTLATVPSGVSPRRGIVLPGATIPGATEPSVPTSGTFSIVMGPLSVSVRVAGEKITSKHLQLVRQYLSVAEAQLKLEAEIQDLDAHTNREPKE